MSGRVAIVGAGPGDPALLTLGALDALRDAGVVLYDALVSPSVLAYVPSSVERVYVGKRGGDHAMSQRDIEALMISRARNGERVVRLKGGDPFVFGRGAEEAEALAAAGIAFSIVPGITSAIAAPAYAGIPLTHRAFASAVVVATGHEDPEKPQSAIDWSRLAAAETLVVLMGTQRLAAIAARLEADGAGAATPAAVIAHGTRPSQRCVVATLGTIADAAAGLEAPAVLVVGKVVALRESLRWFDTGPLFGKRVLVTRPAGGAERFARTLARAGAEPIVAPTVEIGPPDDPRAFERDVAAAASFAWIAFLSQSGVDAVFRCLATDGRDARALAGPRIAAIGPKTADRLRDFGIRAELISGRSTSEDAARDLLDATRPGDRVLVVAAQENRDVARSVLAASGRQPVVAAAYKTTVVTDPSFAQKVAACDAITFTSGSTVRGFCALLGGEKAAVEAARGKIVACIGPITADEARDAGLHVDAVPASFTTDALVAALEEALASAP